MGGKKNEILTVVNTKWQNAVCSKVFDLYTLGAGVFSHEDIKCMWKLSSSSQEPAKGQHSRLAWNGSFQISAVSLAGTEVLQHVVVVNGWIQ